MKVVAGGLVTDKLANKWTNRRTFVIVELHLRLKIQAKSTGWNFYKSLAESRRKIALAMMLNNTSNLLILFNKYQYQYIFNIYSFIMNIIMFYSWLSSEWVYIEMLRNIGLINCISGAVPNPFFSHNLVCWENLGT